VLILSRYFPGILEDIASHGAKVIDFAHSMNWYAYGGFKKNFAIGLDGVLISRPLLEHLIRERVMALPNVRLQDKTVVKRLVSSSDQRKISGILIESKESGQTSSILANLVIDATGRGSHSFQWLKEIGYEDTPVTEVKINVGYTSRMYKRDPEDPRGNWWMGCTPIAPQEKRFGGIIPIEGNRWMVTVGGWHGDNASREETEYLEFVKSLPNHNIYDIVTKCEHLSPLIQYKFPTSIRRHYEKLKRFPTGFLIIGDAISSFNPIYGQGMSSACLQAVELDKVLRENNIDEELAKTYFKSIARIIDNIWLLATGEDCRFPQTIGPRPFAIDLINKYMVLVHKAAINDEVVGGTFLKVLGLLKPPKSLFYPNILWRVLRSLYHRKQIKAVGT
jgi:2-polyprenyl-6-methoxyphenol hydroxylase-like FAD-dependent oxidoreductase